MNELLQAALDIQAFAESRQWPFCFIGGLALQRWGQPRFTRDVDLTLLAEFGGEEPVVDELLCAFKPRRADARAFALRYRVVLIQSADGVGLDVALGALPFEQEAIRRASRFAFAPHAELLTCSAEDLVVMKAFASRPQDWVDIEGIVLRQGSALDRDYVRRQLAPLVAAKEEPDILHRLESLFSARR